MILFLVRNSPHGLLLPSNDRLPGRSSIPDALEGEVSRSCTYFLFFSASASRATVLGISVRKSTWCGCHPSFSLPRVALHAALVPKKTEARGNMSSSASLALISSTSVVLMSPCSWAALATSCAISPNVCSTRFRQPRDPLSRK